MLALAWVIAFVGAIVAYVISLAGAMRTVPRLYWREAVLGLPPPLPLVAGALAGWCLLRANRTSPHPNDLPWIAAGIPIAVAGLTLLLMAVSYFEQPSGPM